METENNKYAYLNDPSLMEKFKKNYLENLNLYLDNEKFEHKMSNLPSLKSATISKLEKLIDKQNETTNINLKHSRNIKMSSTNRSTAFKASSQEKSRITELNMNKSIKEKTNTLNDFKKQHKATQMRYIIMDPENRELDLNKLDSNFEYQTKLMNPYKTYLIEENDKLKRQALEQIISNALRYDKKKKKTLKAAENNNENTINNSQNNTQFNNTNMNSSQISIVDQEYLNTLKNKLQIGNKNIHNYNFETFLKFFNENCEMHNLITVDQKIDYFVHLKGSNALNMRKENERNNKYLKNQATANPYVGNKRKGQGDFTSYLSNTGTNNTNNLNVLNQTNSTNPDNKTPTVRETFASNKSKSLNLDIHYRYLSDLKNKFKIQEDASNIKVWEIFYGDLLLKISAFKSQSKNLDTSISVIEKMKILLNCKEISPEKVVLRECEMTHDKFYFLIAKKSFDFRFLHHINVAKNLLGDIGGAYLLYLIDIYSSKLDYLNISYNKLGKQSTDLLTSILQKNVLRLSSLDIGGNQLGDKNFSEICVGISKNSYLTKLFTKDNELGKIGCTIIGTILRYDKKLKMLDVSKNNFDDNVIGQLLKGLISNVTLETLFLNENNLSNNSLRIFETTFSINSSLKEIFIEKNNFTHKACDHIIDFLNKNKYLEYISLAGNKLKSEHIDKILDGQKKIQIKAIAKTDFYQTKLNEKVNFYEYIY